MAFRIGGIIFPSTRFKPTKAHHAPYGFNIPFFDDHDGLLVPVVYADRIVGPRPFEYEEFSMRHDARCEGALQAEVGQPALYAYHYPGKDGMCGVYYATRNILAPVLADWLKHNTNNIHDDSTARRHAELFCRGDTPKEVEVFYAELGVRDYRASGRRLN